MLSLLQTAAILLCYCKYLIPFQTVWICLNRKRQYFGFFCMVSDFQIILQQFLYCFGIRKILDSAVLTSASSATARSWTSFFHSEGNQKGRSEIRIGAVGSGTTGNGLDQIGGTPLCLGTRVVGVFGGWWCLWECGHWQYTA